VELVAHKISMTATRLGSSVELPNFKVGLLEFRGPRYKT
jgi:hypothetical protein